MCWRLDSSGNLLWDARFPKQAFLHCIQQTSDHGFILTTNDYWGTNVIRFDSIGNYVTMVGETGNEALEVYPNPTNGLFKLEFNGTVQKIQIFNMLGEIVFREETSGKNEIQIDISKNPPGIYFVRISSGEKIFSQKIIKQ